MDLGGQSLSLLQHRFPFGFQDQEESYSGHYSLAEPISFQEDEVQEAEANRVLETLNQGQASTHTRREGNDAPEEEQEA